MCVLSQGYGDKHRGFGVCHAIHGHVLIQIGAQGIARQQARKDRFFRFGISRLVPTFDVISFHFGPFAAISFLRVTFFFVGSFDELV